MKSLLKKLLYLFPRRDKWKLAVLVGLMILGAVLEVIGIGMLPAFVSILATPEKVLGIGWLRPVWNYLNIQGAGDLLIYGSVALMLVFLLKNMYMVGYNYVQARFTHNRFSMIGARLYERYMRAPYIFHVGRNSSVLLRNITQETMLLLRQVMRPMMIIAKDFVLITGIFLFLMFFQPLITLGVLVGLGGGGWLFLRILRNKMRAFGRQAQRDRSAMIKDVNEGIGGIKDIRILNRESHFINRFKKSINSYARARVFNVTASGSTKPVLETIVVLGILLIALTLYLQGHSLETIIPILTLFGAATIRLMPAGMETVRSINQLRYYAYSIDPIYEDTKELKSEPLNDEPEKALHLKHELVLDAAGYRYPNAQKAAVRNVDLTIKKGSVVGFVGPSGAGKTTAVDMMLGLLEPQEGRIMVDGQDIFENLSGWQRNIGYIPQSIFLIDDSLRRNIALGVADDEINEQQLQEAIKAAQLQNLVEELNEGAETIIGEGGIRLSGGQRQRIGIARALYHNPDVLIMDEATSSLDNLTEKYIIEAVERLKGDRTIIMIAHRLTTVENCERLYFMRDGHITDTGTYKELISGNREFQEMAMVD